MKGKISAAKTGTSHSIKNGEYLTGRYVGNDEMGYAYQCITYYVVVSTIVLRWYRLGTYRYRLQLNERWYSCNRWY